MQKKLFGYMFILAIVLLLIFAAFLFLFGRFSTTEDKISDILSLQIEFFDREMTSYYNDIILARRTAFRESRAAYRAIS